MNYVEEDFNFYISWSEIVFNYDYDGDGDSGGDGDVDGDGRQKKVFFYEEVFFYFDNICLLLVNE